MQIFHQLFNQLFRFFYRIFHVFVFKDSRDVVDIFKIIRFFELIHVLIRKCAGKSGMEVIMTVEVDFFMMMGKPQSKTAAFVFS